MCFTTAHPNCGEGTGVISLRSAGDISLHQRGNGGGGAGGGVGGAGGVFSGSSGVGTISTRRGLIVPQQPPNPPTIIPLTHAR